MPCQDKVSVGQMTNEGLESVCKYIPGKEGSLFPKETFNWILSDADYPTDCVKLTISEGVPPVRCTLR